MFQKDWILENMANPTYDVSDLVSLGGVDTSNTQFLSKEQYKKYNFIKEQFKDNQGNFQEQLFNDYYDQQAERWKQLQDSSFPIGLALDPFDTATKKPGVKIRDLGIELGEDFNPNRVKKGIEGFRTISDPTKSVSELAQQSKIWDYEKQEYKDETPEDSSLFSNPIKWVQSLFEEPLVLAQYEEDTIDEFGNEHAKGEYKLNDQGTYYYETLSGRSPIGKQVLSIADILTKENSALNEIDFFDSDDLKKSPAGVIAKNVALIAPMFTPAAPYYYTALIAKELTTTLPMLYNMLNNTFGSGDKESSQWLNTLAARGEQLSTSNSMWSKEHTFSFENLANLISEVALQWGQQKQIVKAVNYFGGGKQALKEAENKAFNYYKNKKRLDEFKSFSAISDDQWKESVLGQKSLELFYKPLEESLRQKQKFGADLALAYMALVSNTDVYATMKEKGATNKEAAWVALGSTLGMYGVDKFLHLGEIFYDDLTDNAIKQSRKLLKDEFNEVREKLGYQTVETPQKWFNIGINYGKKAANTFVENLKDHSLGLTGKSFGEALEEVSEEAVSDLSKGIYSLLGDIGMYEASVKNPIDWETAVERYGMSFIGGAVGGGLFYGVEKYNGYDRHRDKDMLELIRDNKADILRKIVKEEGSKGKAGSSKLSGTKYHRDSESKEVTWLSAEKEQDSQNQAVVNKVLEKINSLEAILIGNNAKLNDDQLFEKMVMDEARYQMYKNASYVTGYYDEFSKRLDNVVTAESNLRLASETIDGTVKGDKATDEQKRELKGDPLALRNKNLQILQATIDQAKQELDLFLSGDSSLDYTRKLNFALDPVLHSAFIPELNYTEWFLENYGLPTDLTPQQRIEIHQKWNDHVKEVMLRDLDKAFLAYKAVEKAISPEMLAQQDFGKTFLKTFQALQGLYKDNADLKAFLEKKPLYNIDSRLIDENGVEEPDEIYELRKNVSTPDAILRYQQRKQKIWDLNNQLLQEYVQQFDDILRGVGYTIDAATNRRLIQNISLVFKDILNRELEYPFIVYGGTFDNSQYKNILQDLKPDLSNIDYIAKQLEQQYYTQIKQTAIQTLANFDKTIPAINKLRNVTKTADFLSVISNIKKSGIENSEKLIEELRTKKRSLSGLTGDAYNQALSELQAMIPEGMESTQLSISTILKNFITKNIGEYQVIADDSLTDENIRDRIGYNLSIQDFLNLMNDPESLVFQYFAEYNETLPQLVYNQMTEASKIFGGDAPIAILTENDMQNLLGPTLQRQMDTVVSYADFVKSRIEKNPLYALQSKLKVQTHSPLENIFNAISKQLSDNPMDISNINYILNQVYTDYVTSDKNDKFLLNDTQEKQLDNAERILDLVKAYVYAASVNQGKEAYFGQNKAINEFARQHQKDLTVKWEDLPEIDPDYAQVLEQEVQGLKKEISVWKAIHANNTMNKLGRLIESESVLNELRYNLSKGLSFKFTIDKKEYDIAEGLDTIPSFDKQDRTSQLATLKEFEQILYNNWNRIKEETGLSDEELFEQSGFLEKIIVGADDIKKQKTSKISEKLKSLSSYDKALYLLSIVSDDPNDYYQSVIDFTKQYDNIAPLPVQLAGARLGESAHTETYKTGFKKLAKIINPNRTVLTNIVHLNGVAGAGKTEVQLKHIRNRYADQKALVIGPTSSQAIKLQNSLNESKSYTFDETDKNNIFRLMFNDWGTISKEFDKAAAKLESMPNKKGGEQVSTDYFTITWDTATNDSARAIITLNSDKIKISDKFNEQLIFVDEAAHLSTFQFTLLDLYADKVKGTVFAASDSSQSGYHKNRIENLNPSATFMTRVPKLTESLRSSNIQKQYNNSKVETLVDTAEDLVNEGDEAAWKSFISKLPKLINNLNLKSYNKEDGINGDIIGADLNEVIKNLSKDVELGFIGSVDSVTYKKLKEAGFTKLSTPLSEKIVPGKPFMQGQEFDYVIIDHLDLAEVSEGIPQNYKAVEFLQRFYTLMSRAKVASIFMDDLSHLVGENVQEDVKSEGFNISKEVALFRDSYTESLDKLEIKPTKEVKTKKKPKKSESETSIEYLEEETKKSIESEIIENKKELKKNLDDRRDNAEVVLDIDNVLEDLIVETTKILPITGLQESYVNEDGSPRKYSKWLVPEKGKVRRNLAALFTGDKPITKLKDKQKLQDILSSIQSAIIFGGDIKSPELSSILTFKEAWENRKIQLEFRKLTDSDNLGIGADSKYFHPITLNGEKYIVSLVCRLDGLTRSVYEEPFSAIFDISILNTPEFIDSKETKDNIKNNINKKIAEGKIKDVARAEQFRDNLDKAIKEYIDFLYLVQSEHPDGFVMDLDSSMYESHKTTRLVHRLTPKRLGGTLAVATIENGILDEDGNYAEDYNNFMDTDKRKVVSPVYIVGSKSDLLEGKISESILGKAVVFVSSNTNLSPDELPERYINQKLDPDSHTPEVRMVVLDNHGLSFNELVTHRVQKQFGGDKPWRMDVLGMRMFTAMWNFRAALENFQKALKVFDDYSEEKLENITKAEREIFEGADVNEILSKYSVTQKDLEDLNNFNQNLAKDIPIFRLGTGEYIRPFDVSNSSVYGKKQVNLLTLSRAKAKQYHSLLSIILEQLTANRPPEEFTNMGLEYTPMDTRIVKPDGTNFDTNQYIGNDKRTLSGLIKTSNKNTTISELDETGKVITKASFNPEAIFSFFPKAIGVIASRSRIYQTNNSASDLISISTIDANDITGNFNFQLDPLFGKGLLQRNGSDNTLFDLFSLIFHGTKESIESDHAYTEEAPFKYGFFIDPDLEVSKEYDNLNIRGENGKNYTFLRSNTHPAYFDVDVDVIPGGFALHINKIKDAYRGKVIEPVKPIEKSVENGEEGKVGYSYTLSEDESIIKSFRNYILNKGLEDTQENYILFMRTTSKKKIRQFFDNKTEIQNITNLINTEFNKDYTDVVIDGNRFLYYRGDSYGELKVDLTDWIIQEFPISVSTDSAKFTDIVKDLDGNDIMTHQEFINTMSDKFEDSFIEELTNATDVNAYLENIKSNYNTILNNYLSTISDEDAIKWKLLDYLDSINNDSNNC